ncbi:hypothetical protein FA15DRAFT_489215 [Coprinopsis marcescibilis]|uniref:C2H2-type domain-containing protein n=1 Tax=Coprinopsis marcescibilis TaxID=230819 RepID=A0A5C3KTD1_COPMA|nr:hypothetical protein FA15DRAFT_489215 [Coprinopsis marcescibilis]
MTAHYPPGFDAFSSFDYQNQQQNQNLEFLSFHSPCELVAPPPDLFEFDIDSGLEGFDDQLQVFTVDQSSFHIPRGPAGPLSTITTSAFSESSGSEDIFSDVSSFYGPPTSAPENIDIFSQIGMGFQRVAVGSDYGAPQSKLLHEDDPTSFGRLPPTPPRSPAMQDKSLSKQFHMRSSYSDYGPPRRSSTSSDYFSHLDFTLGQGTVSPLHISTQLPRVSTPTMPVEDDGKNDPRKKYKCANCPRSFARAYNLKTHMGTHDPNRLKPHVCHHRSCGRSFSRKHDLGRHLVSIHKDDSEAKKEIGVANGTRTWCEGCGKSSIGRTHCDCVDDK